MIEKKNKIFNLFLTFAKIGLFTFGGGYAMISVIENYCVGKKKWITHDEMMNITVIAESTPGPIAINCATFVGYRIAGFWGAVFSTLGVVIPSFIIIFSISVFLNNFLDIVIIANAFKGITAAVGILIVDAAVNMMRKMPRRLFPVAIMLCSFITMLLIDIFSWRFSSISMMLIAAVISLMCYSIEEYVKKERKRK